MGLLMMMVLQLPAKGEGKRGRWLEKAILTATRSGSRRIITYWGGGLEATRTFP